MAREVVRASGSLRGVRTDGDGYKERLLKYIPAEVVVLFVTMTGVIDAAAADFPKVAAHWMAFGFCVVGTILYLRVVESVGNWRQISISTFAFVLWAFALGGPFAGIAFRETWASLALPLYTFLIAIYQGPAPERVDDDAVAESGERR